MPRGIFKRKKRSTGRMMTCKECGVETYITSYREKCGRGKYCSKECWYKAMSKLTTGEKHRRWKKEGSRATSTFHRGDNGNKEYLKTRVKTYDGKWMSESRFLIEKFLGRKLKSTEIVHHINCISLDNRLENLFICSNRLHSKIHQRMGEEYAKMMGINGCRNLIDKIIKEENE